MKWSGVRLLGREGLWNVESENGRISKLDPAPGESGPWLLPGFIDAHCHILPTGLDLQKLHLGACGTRDDVLQSVRERLPQVEAGDWLQAVHYDQTRFPDGQHLTRDELDLVAPDVPVLLRFVNGHGSVANSAALRAAGVREDIQDPVGGTYVRSADGRLNGVLLERAHERVTGAAPEPSLDQMVAAILLAGEKMAEFGITCATDMMTGRWNLERELRAYTLASERGCRVRLRMSMQWNCVLGRGPIEPGLLRELIEAMPKDRCKPIGLKIFADGAIGAGTAAIHGRYLTSGGDGTLIYPPARLSEMVLRAHEAGWAVAIHAIGDRATDRVLDAFEATGEPSRHRIEHIMILSDAQIERLARAGCHATMQPEFLVRFGHAYRRQLGEEVAFKLKRARSVIDAGIPLSFNSDRPIVEGNPWTGTRGAVSRPEGFDPQENVTRAEAIDAYTRLGAIANGDAGQGVIEVGAWDDAQMVTSLEA